VYAGDSIPQGYGVPVKKWPGLSASLALTFPPAALIETRANAMANTTKPLTIHFVTFITFSFSYNWFSAFKFRSCWIDMATLMPRRRKFPSILYVIDI